MMKYILFLILVISIASCKKEYTIAELGKSVPNYTFTNILNSKEKEISLHDLKGKIVILEFWASWCGPCIPAMTKLDSFQNDFQNKIEVITISTESRDRLEKFIASSNTSLRIVSDTIHPRSFKYKTIPHSIIVDENGIIRAITSPENITREVIENLIANNEIDLDYKDDFYINPNLEVRTIKTITNSNYRIDLKSYDQEKRGGSRILRDIDGSVNGIEMWNLPIPRLYQTLFDIPSPHRVFYRDSLSKEDFPYDKEHQYNMTIEVSEEYQKKWKEIAIDFLDENFEVNAKMGVEPLECYILRNVDNIIQVSDADSTDYMFMGTIMQGQKIPISELTDYIENFKSYPVLDKTNLTEEYDINLEWQIADPKTLETELKKYGLEFEKSNKKLPVEIMEIYRKK